MSGIDLANLCHQAPVDGIHAVKIGPVIGTYVPRDSCLSALFRTRLVQDIIAGNHRPVFVAARKLLPKGDVAILIEHNTSRKRLIRDALSECQWTFCHPCAE